MNLIFESRKTAKMIRSNDNSNLRKQILHDHTYSVDPEDQGQEGIVVSHEQTVTASSEQKQSEQTIYLPFKIQKFSEINSEVKLFGHFSAIVPLIIQRKHYGLQGHVAAVVGVGAAGGQGVDAGGGGGRGAAAGGVVLGLGGGGGVGGRAGRAKSDSPGLATPPIQPAGQC